MDSFHGSPFYGEIMEKFEDNSLSERLFRGAGYIILIVAALVVVVIHLIVYAIAFLIAILIWWFKIAFKPV